MIKLYQFPPFFGLPNASPFCLKLETYLRLAKLPFEVHRVLNPRSAPKTKLPFIKDENKVIPDSGMIIDYLKTKYDNNLDAHLTPLQNAQALALQRLIEEHLYWILVYSRWVDELGWKVIKKDFFSSMPPVIRTIVPEIIRKQVKKSVRAHGIGLHNRDEVYQLGQNDLISISEFLGKQDFIFGTQPTSIDACAYGFLANIIYPPIASPLQLFARSRPELMAYCERIKGLAYSSPITE